MGTGRVSRASFEAPWGKDMQLGVSLMNSCSPSGLWPEWASEASFEVGWGISGWEGTLMPPFFSGFFKFPLLFVSTLSCQDVPDEEEAGGGHRLCQVAQLQREEQPCPGARGLSSCCTESWIPSLPGALTSEGPWL